MVFAFGCDFYIQRRKHEKYTVFLRFMSDSFGLLYLCLYGQFFQKPNPSVYLRVGTLAKMRVTNVKK